MTTATALTCRELYDCNPTFAAGINKWVADRRCPIGLGDLLEELGLPAAADCARWAATEPDRPMMGLIRPPGPRCGPMPIAAGDKDVLYWLWNLCGLDQFTHDAPRQMDRSPNRQRGNGSECRAILWLLDNWNPA